MTRQLIIGDRIISDDSDCYVIAEIGHNHQGSLKTAIELFKAAAECGVSAAKLQKRDNRGLYTREMFDKPYENENSFGATYGEHREALEFGKVEYEELQAESAKLGMAFFATAFDFKSADFLADLNMSAYKIASGDLKNTPLLKHVAKIGKPMIVSTGGGTIEDVQRAYDTVMPLNPRLCRGIRRARFAGHLDLPREVSRRGHRLLGSRQRHRHAARRIHARCADYR